MKTRIVKLIILIGLCLFSDALSQSSKLLTGGAFLKIGVGARSMGLGGAYVGLANDVESIYWNPAGLSRSSGNQIHFHHNQWFQGIKYESIQGVHKFDRKNTFGFGINFMHIDGIERRYSASDVEALDTFNSILFSGSLGYSRKIASYFSLGATADFIQKKIDDIIATAFGASLGGLIIFEKPGITIGACARNLGTESKFIDEKFKMPACYDIGVGYEILKNFWVISADLGSDGNGEQEIRAGSELQFGLTANPEAALALRIGYKHRPAGILKSTFVFGAGFQVPYQKINIRMDYAFEPFGILGDTHRISLGIRRACALEVDCQAQPKMFSPDHDGIDDKTVFTTEITKRTKIRKWRLEIYSREARVVKLFSGQNIAPATLIWDGTDQFGRVLPDGTYPYRLIVETYNKQTVKSTLKKIELTSRFLAIDATAHPNYLVLKDAEKMVEIVFKFSHGKSTQPVPNQSLKHWVLNIFTQDEITIKRFTGEGMLPDYVTWDGRDESGKVIAPGKYRYQALAYNNGNNKVKSAIKNFELKRISGNQYRKHRFTMKNVMFDTDKATIRADGIRMLNEVVQVIENSSDCSVVIEGHTDYRGSSDYNMNLSLARANSVFQFLINYTGLAPDRIRVIPYGETKPSMPGSSQAALQLNRRVEIIVFTK